MGKKLRTPIAYYGGKQQLAARIASLLPEHEGYVEPFCGGAAVFWAKPPGKWEVLNDTNRELLNFYEQAKNNFSALEAEVRKSLHSRELFQDAQSIYARPGLFSPVKRAWAVWCLANFAFHKKLNSTFGYDRSGRAGCEIANKRKSFTEDLAIRLRNVTLESCDALRIIRSRDTARTLFYCDPPYINTVQGHYDGYCEADYCALLDELAGIQGKFLLSSYRSEPLKKAVKQYGWHSTEIKMDKPSAKGQNKIEVLTANFPISLSSPSLV